jgi:hypothetical protein
MEEQDLKLLDITAKVLTMQVRKRIINDLKQWLNSRRISKKLPRTISAHCDI